MSIVLVVGGARSGKSTYAESFCKSQGNSICYLATAKPIDEDMADRIRKHRDSRPSSWETIEKYKDFDELLNNPVFEKCDTFLLDCVTIMITNIMFDYDIDYDTCPNNVIDEVEKNIFTEIRKLLAIMKDNSKSLIIVSNEVGYGLVPSYRLGAIFRDIAGRVNQYLAGEATQVYNVICGLPQKIK